MIQTAATLAILILLGAFCGLAFLITIAAEHVVKAIAWRWHERRRA